MLCMPIQGTHVMRILPLKLLSAAHCGLAIHPCS